MSFADYCSHRPDPIEVEIEEWDGESEVLERCKDCKRMIEPATLVPSVSKPRRSCHRCIDRQATAMVEAMVAARATTVEFVVAPKLASVA